MKRLSNRRYSMDDKYKIVSLKYLYSLLDLKKYEKILEINNLESIIDSDEFKYFTLLNDGDISLFNEDEEKEFLSFDVYDIEEILSNKDILNKLLDFVKRTYSKYYFSNTKGEYVYYNGDNEENMAPDDAFALGINYRMNYENIDNYDEKKQEVDSIITEIINTIQFKEAKEKNIKVAVIENNGLKLDNDLEMIL